jgi:hypothetical protein
VFSDATSVVSLNTVTASCLRSEPEDVGQSCLQKAVLHLIKLNFNKLDGGRSPQINAYSSDMPSLEPYRIINQLMLYREIIAVCSEIQTKHINTLCGQNVELLNVKLAVHIVTTGL